MPKEIDTGPASQQEVPISDDPSSKDPPPGGRPADDLPYGADTIVFPFTWSDRREAPVSGGPSSMDLLPEGDMPYGIHTIRMRISWPAAPASGGYNGRMWRMRPSRGWTGGAQQDAPGADEGSGGRSDPAATSPGHAPAVPEQGQAAPADQAAEGGGPASELLAAFRALRAGAPQGRGPTAKEAVAGLSTSDSVSDGGLMLVSDKADGKDDPLHEMRKVLGEETLEEEVEHHHGIDPLHIHGIPPGGGALPLGAGRSDAGSSLPAPRPAGPQTSPTALPAPATTPTPAAPASNIPVTRLPAPSAPAPPPTPDELTRALPGHGNDRHGTQTTVAQQTTRVQTGRAPDGKIAPTTTATRFDSPEAQLDAVNRALARTAARDASGLIPHTVTVAPNGSVRLPRDQSVVTGYPGGYGSGVQLQKPVAPGRPVIPTGQLPNALVVLERQPGTGQWHPVTQYPTDKPVTP